uniref:Cytochrome P450 n=1 Tax=Eocanthecona furcellata TaxID=696902 RepID=A0AA49XCL2_9HEMI|nr:cytochrome P450 [Eocanthecona furcellata]
MLTMDLLILAVAVGLIHFAIIVWKSMTYWKERGVKHHAPVPIFGNFLTVISFRKHFFHFYDKVYKAFPNERMVGLYEFMTPTLVLRDTQLIEQVLIREFSTFPDHGSFLFEPSSVMYDSIFNMSGIRWRALRNKLLITFTTGKMRSVFPSLSESCLQLLNSNPKTLDREMLSDLAIRTFMESMFGTKIQKSAEAEIYTKARKIFEPTWWRYTQQTLLTYFPKLADFLHLTFMPKHLDNYFRSIMDTILSQRMESMNERNDYAQVLVQMKEQKKLNIYNRENKKVDETFDVTNELAIAQAFMFFFAGMDATSLLMLYTASNLAQSKDCQSKAREEIKNVLEKYGGYSWEAVRDMKYLDSCVQETLRMQPSLQFLNRVCDKDTTIDGVKLVKGTRIIIPIHTIQMDPKNFPNPEKFDPERFMEGLNDKFAHLPFSDGPRVCLGKRFATMETTTFMAHLLENFELSVNPETKLPLKYQPTALFLTPKANNPIKIDLKRIN